MKTLYQSVDNVLKTLDDYPADNGEQIWTRAELELYLQDGYNRFCRETKAVFDMFYPENVSPAGNWVARWEREYMASGMLSVGQLNFTGGYWERDYAEAGDIGPIRSTMPWEEPYISTTYLDDGDIFSAFYPVPEDNVTVDRATHDNHQLSAEWTRWFEEEDRDFQETQGDPWRFTMDRDGMSSIRVVPAGDGTATENETTGNYGILRLSDTITDDVKDYGDGLVSYWKMDESSGTRYDAIGDNDITSYSTVSSTTGKVDEAATFAGGNNGPYLRGLNIVVNGDDFTIAGWAKVSSGTFYVFSGASPCRVTITDAGVITASFWDPVSGNEQTVSVDTAVSIADDWVFIVMRFDQTNFTVDIRFYGFGANNATTYTLSGDAWTTAYTTINLYFSYTLLTGPNWGTSAGSVDEVSLYRSYLSNNDCDALYADYGTWAGTGAIGTWGSPREVPEYFPMGGQFGIPRRLYSDTSNTRVEYFRLGKDLDEYGFELPDRFVKYPEFFACAKALERDGPGQDIGMAAHFMERYAEGVARMRKRLSENRRAVVGKIGQAGRVPTKPALARLPWKYGRQIRRSW